MNTYLSENIHTLPYEEKFITLILYCVDFKIFLDFLELLVKVF